MIHKLFSSTCAALILLCAVGAARADVRIKERRSFGGGQSAESGHAFESDVAIKGQRQRTEMQPAPGMKMVSVTQCDMKRILQISDATRKYTVTPIGGDDGSSSTPDSMPTTSGGGAGRVTRGGIVTYVETLTDTGERKQMFGYTARHIKTKTSIEHSADACDKNDFAMEKDGWYIDLEINFECLTNRAPQQQQRPMMRPNGCQDQFRFRRTGNARLGYPVLETTRTLDGNGNVMSEMTTEVVSLSRETLDPALFDVPAGYQLASSPAEMFDAAAMMKAAQQSNGENNENGNNRPQSNAMLGAMNPTGSVGAKQPGAIRVGVVRVGNKTTQSIDAGSLRSVLIASIMESNVEAIPLEESAPDAAQAEAKQKSCDYVLFTDISSLKQSAANKIGGMLGRATGASSGADRFEAKLDYTLVPVAGGSPTQSNATAKEEGGADASANAALRKEAQAVVSKVRK
jgi:hypothetical protein